MPNRRNKYTKKQLENLSSEELRRIDKGLSTPSEQPIKSKPTENDWIYSHPVDDIHPCENNTVEGTECLPDFSFSGYRYDREPVPSPGCTVTYNSATQIMDHIWNDGDVVCVQNGDYTITEDININCNDCILRGAGSAATFLNFESAVDNLYHAIQVQPSVTQSISSATTITTNVEKNSHVIYVDNVMELSPLDEIVIGWNTNDSGFKSSFDPGENWPNLGAHTWIFRRTIISIDEVENKIYFDVPIRIGIPTSWSPKVGRVSHYIENVVIQGLSISNILPSFEDAYDITGDAPAGSPPGQGIDYASNGNAAIRMTKAKDCILKDIKSHTQQVDSTPGDDESPALGIVTDTLCSMDLLSNPPELRYSSDWPNGYENPFPSDVGINGSTHGYVDECFDDDECSTHCENRCNSFGLTHSDSHCNITDSDCWCTCCDPDNIKDLFDDWLDKLLVENPGNVSSDPKHLLSCGIVIDQSRNITIEDCTMKLPQNRGGGGNGYMFWVVNTNNEILFRNCFAFRGRHNFVASKFNSGIVYDNVISNGGWAHLDPSTDWWSRYQQLEIPGFGVPGYSDTHMQLNMAGLITDSTILDGWVVQNRGPMSGGAGITATDFVFWDNQIGNPDILSEPHLWQYASVPGLGVIKSFQADNGFIYNQGIKTWGQIFTDIDYGPEDWLYYLAESQEDLLPYEFTETTDMASYWSYNLVLDLLGVTLVDYFNNTTITQPRLETFGPDGTGQITIDSPNTCEVSIPGPNWYADYTGHINSLENLSVASIDMDFSINAAGEEILTASFIDMYLSGRMDIDSDCAWYDATCHIQCPHVIGWFDLTWTFTVTFNITTEASIVSDATNTSFHVDDEGLLMFDWWDDIVSGYLEPEVIDYLKPSITDLLDDIAAGGENSPIGDDDIWSVIRYIRRLYKEGWVDFIMQDSANTGQNDYLSYTLPIDTGGTVSLFEYQKTLGYSDEWLVDILAYGIVPNCEDVKWESWWYADYEYTTSHYQFPELGDEAVTYGGAAAGWHLCSDCGHTPYGNGCCSNSSPSCGAAVNSGDSSDWEEASRNLPPNISAGTTVFNTGTHEQDIF